MSRKSATSVTLERKHYNIIDDHDVVLSRFIREKLEELEKTEKKEA